MGRLERKAKVVLENASIFYNTVNPRVQRKELALSLLSPAPSPPPEKIGD
jgi:hypothetical protein